MSGLQAANGGGDGRAAPPLEGDEVERIARANGWRPREEFKGPPDAWVPAETFVARGVESPAVLRERNIVLSNRMEHLERAHRDSTAALTAKLDSAVEALHSVTAMTRSAESRAFDRARRELREQQATAVANADTPTFTRLQSELDELEKDKPAPAPPAPTTRTTPPAPATTTAPPEAVDFFARNRWYQQDPELQEEADIIHTGLLSKRPNYTLGQNLAEVERRMKENPRFAQRIAVLSGTGAPARTSPAADDQGGDGDDRRDAPSNVTPSSGGRPPRRAARRSFDTMPQDAKDAYAKYKALLDGKGEPFTKEEYATNYWEQFAEDGT